MKVALAQTNPVVGDIAGNAARHAAAIDRAAAEGAELVVFSELSLAGYPPRDLLKKRGFVDDCLRAAGELAGHCRDTAALVGLVRPNPDPAGRPLQNAAALLAGGEIRSVHVKTLLPSYDVFDETRYFQPEARAQPLELAARRLGVSICEDLWDAESLGRELYGQDPLGRLVEAGAQIVVNMAASPYEAGKAVRREELFSRQARRAGCPILYVNQVGGNDELIFDGSSCVVSAAGEVIGRAKSFQEDLLLVDLDGAAGRREAMAGSLDRLRTALQLGLRDYVRKCGMRSVVLGLSGGIDSALVAVLAADALGAENVSLVAMPSRYSSDHSLRDAAALAANLGAHFHTVGIEPMHAAFETALGGMLAGAPGAETAAENVQARSRGIIVMAASNAYGHLALATGNKSELSVGYCTLYGDMAGGLAPIGDVLKTNVYELCRRINERAGGERIPRNILEKPPSAELKPGQVDQDKLPPYDTLDEILRRYVEQDESAEGIVEAGFEAGTVERVVRMVDLAEFKRRQAAPALKVSPRAFGMGRRMPIAQRYRPAASR
jgi:NAD+ synthase (glutamine-hydrolysing)